MNTPRTRPIKRYPNASKPKKGRRLPDAHYQSSLFNAPDHARLLGQLVSYWTHLEDQMVDVMGLLLGDKRMPSRQIFRSVVSEHTRIQVLRALLEQAPLNKDKGREFDEIIDAFASLNSKRNSYVHGQWATHESGKVFISESSTDEFHFFDKREVKLKELETVLHEMGNLWRKILLLVEPRLSQQAPPPPTDEAPS